MSISKGELIDMNELLARRAKRETDRQDAIQKQVANLSLGFDYSRAMGLCYGIAGYAEVLASMSEEQYVKESEELVQNKKNLSRSLTEVKKIQKDVQVFTI